MKIIQHSQLGYLFAMWFIAFPKELKTKQTSLGGHRLERIK